MNEAKLDRNAYCFQGYNNFHPPVVLFYTLPISFAEVYLPHTFLEEEEGDPARIVRRGRLADGSDLIGRFLPGLGFMEVHARPFKDVIEICSFDSESCSARLVT